MRLVLLLGFLLLPLLAQAADFLCGDTTHLHRFSPSVDATVVAPCPPPFVLSQLPDDVAVLTAQRELYRTMAQAGTVRHLKVESERMVEMTQAEKDAVDLPAQQQAAATAVAQNEITTNEVCANHTLAEITEYWKGPAGKQAQLQTTIATLDSAIAAVTAGPARTAIQAARDAVVAHMTMFINDSELQWRYICSRTFVRP